MPTANKETILVEGQTLTLSNPDKLLWPEDGITKIRFLERLTVLAPYLLKHCRNRYLTTIRYPDGVDRKSFYQKNCPEPVPDFVNVAEMNGIRYVHLDSLPTLIWLGNLACLEFHTSFHAIGSDEPAEWVIDIDPSLESDPRVFEAAFRVGEALKTIGIHSVPKTSGATGVQIIVPIEPRYSFEQLRRIGRFLGHYMLEKYPKWFTLERLKKDRGDHIYIDYLQHWPGKTLSAPYTPRARKGAPVSTPLTWDELADLRDPAEWNLFSIEQRLRERGDLLDQAPPQTLDHVLAHIR